MDVSLGFKVHSGWAALVSIAKTDCSFIVVDRQRLDFVTERWAKQPYHAAEELEAKAARAMVKRGVDEANKATVREVRSLLKRYSAAGWTIIACGVLVSDPMPDWSVDQILAVHIRMHKAEGVLFKDALLTATNKCGLPSIGIREKQLLAQAEKDLNLSQLKLSKLISELGKSFGPPWGRDQKDSAMTAIIALTSRGGDA
jgi:hypothetical protein